MKKRMVGIVVVLGLVGLLAGNVDANMIRNGGFEDGDAGVPYGSSFSHHFPLGTYHPDHWSTSGSAGYWYGNAGNHTPGGHNCIGTWSLYTYAYQENIAVQGGVDYTLSAWCKPVDWAAGVGGIIEVIWFPAGVDPTMGNYSQRISRVTAVTYVPAPGDIGSWVFVEDTIASPANAAGAMVLVGNKDGSGWTSGLWDDVSMVPEPVTLGFLVSGALFGVFRRKRIG